MDRRIIADIRRIIVERDSLKCKQLLPELPRSYICSPVWRPLNDLSKHTRLLTPASFRSRFSWQRRSAARRRTKTRLTALASISPSGSPRHRTMTFERGWAEGGYEGAQLAIADGTTLAELGLGSADEANIEIVEEPNRGFLGMGAREALVRVTPKPKKETRQRRRKRGGGGEQGRQQQGRGHDSDNSQQWLIVS